MLPFFTAASWRALPSEKKQDVFLEKFVINGKYSRRRARNSEDGRREFAHLQALNIDLR
jgi:hypothetical protein